MNKIVARLLATENIRVINTKHSTAWFDLEKRILGMPQWQNVHKDVEAMLVCHEVGHALFTPLQGWHDAVEAEVDGVPRTYLNIVEDPRQEKLFKRKYPGSIRIFNSAHKILTDIDFFGLKNRNISKMLLSDRINLFFKSTHSIDFYNQEELDILSMVKEAETFDDCIEAAKALKEYDDEYKKSFKKEDIEQPIQDARMDEINDELNDDFDTEDDDDFDTLPSDSSDEESDEDDDDFDTLPSDSSDEESEENELGTEGENTYEESDEGEENVAPITDKMYRDAEKKLAESDTTQYSIPSLNTLKTIRALITHEQVLKQEELNLESCMDYNRAEHTVNIKDATEAYTKLMMESKAEINHMVHQFEMKRAAWKNARVSIKKTGRLEPTRLSKYRFTDEIFANYTVLPQGQNHGMLFFIDFSCSMHNTIMSVVKQTLKMTAFCRKVGIPFEVYTFTSRYGVSGCSNIYGLSDAEFEEIYERFKDIIIVERLSSEMSKSGYNNAAIRLLNVASRYSTSVTTYDDMGGTPLYETYLVADRIIPEFQRRVKCEKTAMIVLSDGVGFPICRGLGYDKASITMSDGTVICSYCDDDYDIPEALTKAHGVDTIHLFITNNLYSNTAKQLARWVCRKTVEAEKYSFTAVRSTAASQLRKEGILSMKQTRGFKVRIALNMSATESGSDEMERPEKENTAQFTKAFMQSATKKKMHRVFAEKLMEIVA